MSEKPQLKVVEAWLVTGTYEGSNLSAISWSEADAKHTAEEHVASYEPVVIVPREEWERMLDVVREFLAEKEHFRAYPEIWKNKYADIEELLK